MIIYAQKQHCKIRVYQIKLSTASVSLYAHKEELISGGFPRTVYGGADRIAL